MPTPTEREPEVTVDSRRSTVEPRRRKDDGFGKWLQRLREQTGLSQAEVARRMGTSPASVWRLEHGRWDPRLSTILRYGDAIGARLRFNLTADAPDA